MAKPLSQASDIVAVLEDGDLNNDLSAEIQKVLAELQDLAPANGRGKVKGSLTLKIDFMVSGKSVEIESSFASKLPKRPRASSTYFVTPDAKLSVDHPQQRNMEFGPQEVKLRESNSG